MLLGTEADIAKPPLGLTNRPLKDKDQYHAKEQSTL
jgi:hypothetical protein